MKQLVLLVDDLYKEETKKLIEKIENFLSFFEDIEYSFKIENINTISNILKNSIKLIEENYTKEIKNILLMNQKNLKDEITLENYIIFESNTSKLYKKEKKEIENFLKT